MSKVALFPGSFNPFTAGHANIVERGLKLFDKVIIGIALNPEKDDEKHVRNTIKIIDGIKKRYEGNDNVAVMQYNGLTGDIVETFGINAILRGIRNDEDLKYENEIAKFNYSIFGAETVYLLAEPELKELSSTMVRELKRCGKEIPEIYI